MGSQPCAHVLSSRHSGTTTSIENRATGWSSNSASDWVRVVRTNDGKKERLEETGDRLPKILKDTRYKKSLR